MQTLYFKAIVFTIAPASQYNLYVEAYKAIGYNEIKLEFFLKRKMYKLKSISIKTQLYLFLFCFLAIISFNERSFNSISKGLIALLVSALLDLALFYIREKRPKITESSLITGLIIGFVLSSDMSWWAFALASLLAIMSKHIIRYKNKHVFNPAAFGIFFTILITNGYTQWKGAYDWAIIIPFGLYFAFKMKKLLLVIIYFILSLILYSFEASFDKASFINSILYANYFFMFIMLTEPKTSPFKNRQKMIISAIIAIASFLLYLLKFPYDPVLPSLLIGNLLFCIMSQVKK
ncbi:MAG: hypothetical protein A2Y03_09950 [Omnitrophica WOR_2 bacterium GWF2_38_59]|nr:MAG: hypothetical protein A2Y03_09950 [Omnitrophica WOR_2 bacterium GWF2_38_59]OGX50842.1 MAG: hypothetical protein A2243_06055 [Omnitrophica WOR_2 bacterium RIFOXYA2_FULL_38_17]OGX53390.1 MAG: hypothetical protein A2267_01695 [Omnitrophica WOR_2 bacterium RIFOXYA12_FULL_38_10]OGX59082.1 MAG: hypothetical protein A2306_03525 [Omnitrophica WOR_2 bacterium RIFOXYB2_FULL_38_16]HBG60517.1 hypothetical protein [Candidatus Omnitrophota bacterium]